MIQEQQQEALIENSVGAEALVTVRLPRTKERT